MEASSSSQTWHLQYSLEAGGIQRSAFQRSAITIAVKLFQPFVTLSNELHTACQLVEDLPLNVTGGLRHLWSGTTIRPFLLSEFA